MTRAIEEYFPIVDINRLAVPERNAFKPIYQMHKWFARRSSSVFRAILLAAMKPAGMDIMKEFYLDHTNDPDTNGKVILDPFMGGGTTVVEALRLGCNVIGIDLNPVAWFIVKTEVEPVDIDSLKASFERLANRTVDWSGKPLKETLLDLYKTVCPGCGGEADIIYTFWVKSAPCTTGTCKTQTPLFSDFIIAQKKPSIRYSPDCTCPSCAKEFDWEREPASLIAEEKLMVSATAYSAGDGRQNARWAFSADKKVTCPWCRMDVRPKPKSLKLKRKKIPLNVLLCPHCEEVWQYRGELPDSVACPTCAHEYDPTKGNIPGTGKFICRGTCNGNVDTVITAIRTLPEERLLPIRLYAMEGYCPRCAKKPGGKETPMVVNEPMFEYQPSPGHSVTPLSRTGRGDGGEGLLWKNSGKFFKRVSPVDLARYLEASSIWQREKKNLPHPVSEIPVGEKTKSGLHSHHYRYWWQMFNDRQLLALSTLLKGIGEEGEQVAKEMLLTAFFSALETSNLFTRYHSTRFLSAGVFARHDYQPKVTICENNVWGTLYGNQTYNNTFEKVIDGKSFALNPTDLKYCDEKYKPIASHDSLSNLELDENVLLKAKSSTNMDEIENSSIEFVITDPPYAGNVNYAELSDFFYVWLRLLLKEKYPQFLPEYVPKAEEIIENRTRGKSSKDFKEGLRAVFREGHRVLKDDGLLVFTFHHAEGSAWEALLESVCEAGYYIEAVYPIHGEAENSLHLMNNEAISYDLIHVCKKATAQQTWAKRSWAGVRHDIRKRAREEARLIESGRYGNEPLPAADINILLIGKCLELYSKHYNRIVDHEDKPIPLHQALEEIKMLVDQIVAREKPLPPELEEGVDPVSYVYLTALAGQREIQSDHVSKQTRGIIETSELKEHGLLIKGRAKRGRTFEIKQPVERLNDLKKKFYDDGVLTQLPLFGENGSPLPKGLLFVDCVQLLLGLAENGENVLPWLDRLRGLRPQLRAALSYLHDRNIFTVPSRKILSLIDERTLFNT